MIRSMTGYGQVAFQVDGIGFEAEVRTLNHRFLDLRLRLPRALAAHEVELRARVAARVRRGKVEVSVRTASESPPGEGLAFDYQAAERYLEAARELRERHALPGELDVGSVLRLPGVARLVEPSPGGEALWEAVSRALDGALDSLTRMREAEGAALARELEQGLARIEALAGSLEARAGTVQQAVRERLRKRAEQLRDETGLLDEARLHQEIVLAADRLDVNEELARLRSHVEQFRGILAESATEQSAGRRLGFLLQEMMREANTVGSKGADAPIATQVVELKTELERLREQVQNVE